MSDPPGRARATLLTRVAPRWAVGYDRSWLRDDLLAGGTVAVMLIPQAMAYAALAGVPPVAGLYAALVALVVYAAVGTSSHLSFGPVAIVSLLTAAVIEPLAAGDPGRALALAGLLALLVGAIHLLLGLLRAGAVVTLISHPVIVGFTAAAALVIGLSQVRDLLGVDAPRTDRVVDAVRIAIEAFPATHLLTAAIAGLAIAGLVLGKRLAPRFPTALTISALAVVATVVFGLEGRGVAIVGEIPAGPPRPALAGLHLDDVVPLLAPAAIIALISYAESISIARAIAARTRERLDANRELIASGVANLAVGGTGGHPVAGSFTRTAVTHDAGARTQLAGLVAAGIVLLTITLLTSVLEPLPRAILAAIVILAVVGLIDVRGAVRTFRIDRRDGVVLVTTFAATLLLGVELGLLIGVAANLVIHVAGGMRPALVELGRVVGTRTYRNVARFPAITDQNGAILRLDGPLDFLSVTHVTRTLREISAQRPQLRWLILDASACTDLDSTGVHELHALQEDLAEADVELHLTTVRGPLRDVIDRAGLWSALIEGTTHPDIATALDRLGVPEDAPVRVPGDDEEAPHGLL